MRVAGAAPPARQQGAVGNGRSRRARRAPRAATACGHDASTPAPTPWHRPTPARGLGASRRWSTRRWCRAAVRPTPPTSEACRPAPSPRRRDLLREARFSQLALAGREVDPRQSHYLRCPFTSSWATRRDGAARSQTAHPGSFVSCSVHRSARRPISLGGPLPIPGNPGAPLPARDARPAWRRPRRRRPHTGHDC